MRDKGSRLALRAVTAVFTVILLATNTWAVPREKVLHNFKLSNKEGNRPRSGLIFDAAGNIYGTTTIGGDTACDFGCGTVFELTPKADGGWTERVLHYFHPNGREGTAPDTALIFDSAGDLYGTTTAGAAYGTGTVFELMPTTGGHWTAKVLHEFHPIVGDGEGSNGLIFDAAGNLYTSTANGGAYGYGTVFELIPQAGGGWKGKVLHSFRRNGRGGEAPIGGVVFDAAGNLYGTTYFGGAYGSGTVFELTPNQGGGWGEIVLHHFNNNTNDGVYPSAGLIMDAAGNLYGTTYIGGAYRAGTVFELMPKAGGGWRETVLHSFNTDGFNPTGGLIMDAAGNLYGTTYENGADPCGTAFELTPKAGRGWRQTVLHRFSNYKGGAQPFAGLTFDPVGNLFGTTIIGGAFGYGTVFEIIPLTSALW